MAYTIGIPAGFNPTTTNVGFLYVAFQGNEAKSYSSSQCVIMVKSGASSAIKLTTHSVNITEYNSNVIGGTFSGDGIGGSFITGSFLFRNVGDDNWYSSWSIPW